MKTTNELIRKLMFAAAVLGAAVSASAAGNGVDVFTIQGYVNFGATLGPVVSNTFGIASGDSFTGTLTYDSSAPPIDLQGPGSSVVGYRLTQDLVSINVRGQNFNFFAPYLYVSSDVGTWEIANVGQIPSGADGAGWIAGTPWGSFYSYGAGGRVGSFTLLNTPGFALPDHSLPTQLDIADWSTEHELDMSYVFHTIGPNGTTIDGGSIFLRAILTSITVAPEPGTMAILGLGFAGCVLFRRRRHG